MRKILSAILILALALTAVCAMAAQAEEADGETDSNTAVVYNFLAELADTDGSYYTVKNNEDGSVTVTLKQEATQEEAIILATYADAKVDLSQPTFFAADFKTENPDIDFRLHYTRKDYEDTEKNGIADLYFTGMKKAADYTKSSTDASIVWDFAAYVSGAKRYEDNIHEIKNLAITTGNAGDVITFNTLAIVNDENAMTVGTPLVGAAGGADDESSDETTSDETSSDETTSDETTSDETSPEDSTSEPSAPSEAESSASSVSSESSGPVPAGDVGVVLYVILALLAAVGAIAVVRIRQE